MSDGNKKTGSPLFAVPRSIWQNPKLVVTLAGNDFRNRFAGSYLGRIWAFIQPVVTVLVYWFVFQVGFRAALVSDYPYVIYLVVGIVPWFFFSDALNGGANSLVEYSYLVKKVVFNIDILPAIKVISAAIVHMFFILVALVLVSLGGYAPVSVYALQFFYYELCLIFLVTGMAYLCAAITVFFRDMLQIINIIILQLGMWLTPIMWDPYNTLPPIVLNIFKLNPMFYIVDGYRDAFLYHRVFWVDKPLWSLYFWAFSIGIYALGMVVFRKLKVHFADVL
ncbi:MAG: ABC transporter permease [Eubacterium sp.]|nr:ABC transporter permease [Eubacterium sp.]